MFEDENVGDHALQRSSALPMNVTNSQAPGVVNVGGILEIRSASQLVADEKAKAEEENSEAIIQGLAGHIRNCWEEAKRAKEEEIEQQMLKSLRQRNGEYDPDIYSQLKSQGSSAIYMLITSNKCRAGASWLREALDGMPWSAKPTPVSDIDENTKKVITDAAAQQIQAAILMGYFPSDDEVRDYMLAIRDQVFAKIQEMAKRRAERMTEKMKDQLIEGGFPGAMDAFIDDLVTFPAAFLKGPVIRKRPLLKWVADGQGQPTVAVTDGFRLEWERVDPFNIYPAPDATDIDDGYLIERHKLSRADLVALREVEGYSAASINAALDDYGRTGLQEWMSHDSERMMAEGKSMQVMQNPSGLIDALQFWGSVQGQKLIDWGVEDVQVEDPLAEYHIEAWLVGRWIIKATINPDPLHRKPYYKTSWENIPGRFWGRSIPDLCRDTQSVCNAAARALVDNMSISSGPQVTVDVSRLPAGETLTNMYPWKIWQTKDNGMGTQAMPPVSFFQPGSNAIELMQIFEKFSVLADEYTGIPRYMTGNSNVGGAASTASGMSMLLSNAGKTIKNVVASIDRILQPAIERLYMYNMMYLDDPELKGDVNIVAEGATSLIRQQAQQQRLNEFTNIAVSNPVLSQLIGPEGLAYLTREVVKQLGLDTDRIIPSLPVLKARMAAQNIQNQRAAAAQLIMQQQAQGNPQAGGSQAKPDNDVDKRRLMDGSPQHVTKASNAPQVSLTQAVRG